LQSQANLASIVHAEAAVAPVPIAFLPVVMFVPEVKTVVVLDALTSSVLLVIFYSTPCGATRYSSFFAVCCVHCWIFTPVVAFAAKSTINRRTLSVAVLLGTFSGRSIAQVAAVGFVSIALALVRDPVDATVVYDAASDPVNASLGLVRFTYGCGSSLALFFIGNPRAEWATGAAPSS
jgi:hypothetical protein